MTVVVWQISGKRRDYSINGAGISGCPYEKKREIGFLSHTADKSQLQINQGLK